jgi:hypothetical protein
VEIPTVAASAGDGIYLGSAENDGDVIRLPFSVQSAEALLGLEFTLRFPEEVVTFVGIEEADGLEADFFSAKAEGGRIRMGMIEDLELESTLPSGRHLAGELKFRVGAAIRPGAYRFAVESARLVRDDLTAALTGGGGTEVPGNGTLPTSSDPTSPRIEIPNPYRVNTQFTLYGDTSQSRGEIEIYNVQGQRVRSLFQGQVSTSAVELRWDGRTDTGDTVSPGIYYVRGRVGTVELRKKILLAP